jgi:hypothetical protein
VQAYRSGGETGTGSGVATGSETGSETGSGSGAESGQHAGGADWDVLEGVDTGAAATGGAARRRQRRGEPEPVETPPTTPATTSSSETAPVSGEMQFEEEAAPNWDPSLAQPGNEAALEQWRIENIPDYEPLEEERKSLHVFKSAASILCRSSNMLKGFNNKYGTIVSLQKADGSADPPVVNYVIGAGSDQPETNHVVGEGGRMYSLERTPAGDAYHSGVTGDDRSNTATGENKQKLAAEYQLGREDAKKDLLFQGNPINRKPETGEGAAEETEPVQQTSREGAARRGPLRYESLNQSLGQIKEMLKAEGDTQPAEKTEPQHARNVEENVEPGTLRQKFINIERNWPPAPESHGSSRR